MRSIVSIVIERLEFFDADATGLAIHGANLTIAAILRGFAAHESVEALEVFLPPALMLDQEELARIARSVLPAERQGQGRLRFYPYHSLPDVWSDGQSRVVFTPDPERMARDRYLRDRFATAPTVVISDTHAHGHHALIESLARLASGPAVPFDSMACLSAAYLEAMRRTFDGFLLPPGSPPPCRLDLLPHGIDTDLFQPADEKERRRARRLLSLPEEGQIVLFLGRVTAHSKADLLPLLRAFRDATDRPDDYLVIAGAEYPYGYVQKLREAGAALGLQDRLIVRGEFPNPFRPLYYAAADLFVFPGDTIQEALANTVLEAMASGLPTIVSDWDGMRDSVVDAETGFLVPTYWMPAQDRIASFSPFQALQTEYLFVAQTVWVDTTALRERLRTLMGSRELRERMGRAGRERMEARYTWPAVFGRWEALWTELLEIARQETEEEARRRRAAAFRLATPTAYETLYGHYATHKIAPDLHWFRLSDLGTAAVSEREPLRFYDETLPLLRQEVIDALFLALRDAYPGWLRLADLTWEVGAKTERGPDDIRFHLALLLKRDLLEIRAGNPAETANPENARRRRPVGY